MPRPAERAPIGDLGDGDAGAAASEKVEAIASAMQDLTRELVEAIRPPGPSLDEQAVLAAARDAQAARRRRAALFGERTFVEPGWDMLLDLFVARLEKKPISVTSACAASFAPTSTALRYVAHLEELGLIARKPHPSDSRSKYLEITDRGAAKMMDLFGHRPAARNGRAG